MVTQVVSDPDFVPGTTHLVDLEGTLRAQHAKGADTEVVLIPTPSSDPDDPLNWSKLRKFQFISCICAYCLAIGLSTSLLYSVLVPIADATGLTINNLNAGTGYMFLALGWGCLFWQPLAQKFGKRPVYLVSLLGSIAVNLWAPYSTNEGAWYANKIIQGFLGAPIESLCEISVADVYFTHERGTYVGLYALFLVGSNFLAPIMAGFMNDSQGWRWVLLWGAIFNGVSFVICFLFMEETNYSRKAADGLFTVGENAIESGSKVAIDSSQDHSKMEKLTNSGTTTTNRTGQQKMISTKSFISKLAFIRRQDLNNSVPLKGMFVRPFAYFTIPGVVFSGFMYGSNVCYFNMLNGTVSVLLTDTYGFAPSMVGLSYFSCVVGVVIGCILSGRLGDKFVLWKARRNNGIMEPEFRLWLYCMNFIFVSGGFLLWGLGTTFKVHPSGVIFAMGMLGAGLTAGAQLPISYCIDCYRDLGADAIVTVMLIRNTMSFAVSYGVTPWLDHMGVRNTFLILTFVSAAQYSMFLIFVKFGKRMRIASISRYNKYVKQVKDDGLLH